MRKLPDNIEKRLQLATEQNAVQLRDAIKEGIIDQAPGGEKFAPLNPMTITRRLNRLSKGHRRRVERKAAKMATAGGTAHKALINDGDLLGAVTYVLSSNKLSAAVGVKRGAKAADGEDIVNIAKILNDGAIINVTPKMRAYLAATGTPLKAATTQLIIPPRPFILPVYRQLVPAMRARYRKALEDAVRIGAR